jgi:clan AA aspartic protease
MGNFYEKITLENNGDRTLAERGYIQEDQIHILEVEAMPDTGAWRLVLNEETRQKLGLKTIGSVKSFLADGSSAQYDLTESVGIRWKNRYASMEAVVAPGAKAILLGAMPLEALDLCVDTVNQKLVGVHGDEPVCILYGTVGKELEINYHLNAQ